MTNDEIRDEIEAGREELRHTTITYPNFVKNVNTGYYKQKGIDPVTGTAWGRAFKHLDTAQDALVTQPPPPVVDPPPGIVLPTLDAFRVTLEPDNHEQAGKDHYSGCWSTWTSPFTPDKAPNGQPAARYLPLGKRFFMLKFWMFEQQWCYRDINFHACATPSFGGWEQAVSSLARDARPGRGETGHSVEWALENEREQDLDPGSPHSGGAHFGLPDSFAEHGVWFGNLHEIKLGKNRDGIFRVWDWATGLKLIDLQNVNTCGPNQTWVQLWEGGYNSSSQGMPTGKMLQLPALFGNDIPSLLKDTPRNVTWNSQNTSPDSSSGRGSRIDLNVARIQIPSSPLIAAAA